MLNPTPPASSASSAAVGAVPANAVHIKVENYLSQTYLFRYNEVNGKIEFKEIAENVYKSMSDFDFNSILRELINADIKCTASILKSLLFSNYTPVYNPFKDYFQNLPKWDGQTDHIEALSKTVSTTNDSLWHLCFKKWMVAMVGCAIDENVTNHTVIVFMGNQGIGKTTWTLSLLPRALKDYCFSGTINPNNKDTLIQLSETILINMDELENLNKSELGTLKELITKSAIRIRRPYGMSNENIPRRASFMGSVNAREFLNDSTGNRRFLCFEALQMNYLHQTDMELVYAQAYYLFKTGFRFWLDPSETEMINKNNAQFRNLSMEEELLNSYFTPCDANDADYLFTTTDLLTWLTQKARLGISDSAKQKMGRALKANGFLRIKRQDRWVYALKEILVVPEAKVSMISTANLADELFRKAG